MVTNNLCGFDAGIMLYDVKKKQLQFLLIKMINILTNVCFHHIILLYNT